MTREEASKALVMASAELNALRIPYKAAVGAWSGKAEKPEDQAIIDAWYLAERRFRTACQQYIEAVE